MDKKTKIREYKDTARPMGVFEIKNKINGNHLARMGIIDREENSA